MEHRKENSRVWQGEGLRRTWSRPLPHMRSGLDRLISRLVMTAFGNRVVRISGLEWIAPDLDPFILTLNHNQRLEAVLLPVLLMRERDGKMLHFLADWNFKLIPIVATIFRRGQTITVTRKDARPRILNIFKPLFHEPLPALTRARHRLDQGASIGIFPEGKVNRNPRRLMRGHPGAARLSLESGVRVVPAGIRFPGHDPSRPIRDRDRMEVVFGPPLEPPTPSKEGRAPAQEVRAWHDRIMNELGRLSGKQMPRSAPGGE